MTMSHGSSSNNLPQAGSLLIHRGKKNPGQKRWPSSLGHRLPERSPEGGVTNRPPISRGAAAWARSCLDAARRRPGQDDESEVFDRLHAQRLQNQLEESDRRRRGEDLSLSSISDRDDGGGWTTGDDATAGGGSSTRGGASAVVRRDFFDGAARCPDTLATGRKEEAPGGWAGGVAVAASFASEPRRSPSEIGGAPASDAAAAVQSRGREMRGRGPRRQQRHERTASPRKDDPSDTEESRSETDRDSRHLLSLDEVVDLKLLVAHQRTVLDALALDNRRLATDATEWRQVAERRCRELAERNGELARENAQLRAALERLAPSPSPPRTEPRRAAEQVCVEEAPSSPPPRTEPRRVDEVQFDCRMVRRSSSLVGSHHSSFATCATAESSDTFDLVGAVLDGVADHEHEYTARASNGSLLRLAKSYKSL